MKNLIICALLCVANFVSTAKENFKTWKTVTLGQQTRQKGIAKLKKDIGWFDEKGFEKIPISRTQKTMKLVLVTPKELGFTNTRAWAVARNYEKILELAKKKGLQVCPQEVALLVFSNFQRTRNCSMDGNQATVIATSWINQKDQYGTNLRSLFMLDYNNGDATSRLRLQVVHGGGDWDDTMDPKTVRFVFVQP